MNALHLTQKNVSSAWKDEDETSLEWYKNPKMFHGKRYMHTKIEKGDTDTDAHAHTHTHTHAHCWKCRLRMAPYSTTFNYVP